MALEFAVPEPPGLCENLAGLFDDVLFGQPHRSVMTILCPTSFFSTIVVGVKIKHRPCSTYW